MTNIFLKTILLGLFLSLCLEDLSLAEAFPKELKRLENIQGSTSVFMDSGVRDKAQREAAYFSSIQAGSLWRYQQIVENVLKPREKSLDALFDFDSLVTREGDLIILPPVITQAGSALRVETARKRAVSQGKSYRMVKKARLSSTLPNWRSYLYLDLKDPEELHPSLLPRDGTERVRWRERVHKGWAIGVEQADVIFQSRVAELVRDYTGMLLFLELNGNHIVLPPKVKVSLQGKNITETELIYDLTNYGLEKDGSFRITPKNTRGR